MTKFNLTRKAVRVAAYTLVFGATLGLLALILLLVWLGVLSVFNLIF